MAIIGEPMTTSATTFADVRTAAQTTSRLLERCGRPSPVGLLTDWVIA
jgi:hypothetical protein